MDNDFDGAIGRAMAVSSAQESAKTANQKVVELERRVAILEQAVNSLRGAAYNGGGPYGNGRTGRC